jgi:truncated hemoglobin YjbI/quinol monooxygenase YgiN
MIVEYVRYRLEKSDAAAFEAAYQRASEWLRASPHCLGYELARSEKEPARYTLRIHWDSAEGHLQGFRRSEHFRAFFAEIKPFIAEIEEMEHYRRTPVRSETLAEAAGGPETFFRIARAMHDAMCEDQVLGDRFRRAAETHVPHLGMWLTEVFGGPKLYTAVLDDIAPMLRRHARQDITEDERTRFVACATKAVESVVGDARLRAPIVEYLAWGSTIAVENSRPDHRPDPQAGVPTWPWTPE